MKLRSVRGTHDIFGEEIDKFNRISNIVSKNANLNNFKEIQTPIFEFSDLFAKPLGEQSDVVLKEMYTFEDRNNELLTLRPEYTTPMIRAAITNNLLNDLPLKIFGLGPMFRRERPQKGRYRQFNQINFEIFGTNDFMADLELIIIGNEILKSILPNSRFILNLNTLGQKNNLNEYKIKLSNYFKDKKEKLSDESKEKIQTNPLRILDSKNENDKKILANAPNILEYLNQESRQRFHKVTEGLDVLGIKYCIDKNLVRGLDYYCHTAFEFTTNDLGAQGTVLAGGRYDGLSKFLGGSDVPGVGWAAGIERLALMVQSEFVNKTDVVLIGQTENFNYLLLPIMKKLIQQGIKTEIIYTGNLSKKFTRANKINASYAIILGEEDLGPRTKLLSNGPMARKQGPNCLTRGKLLYSSVNSEAKQLDIKCGWNLITVPGVGHDNFNIAPVACEYLFGKQ